MNFKHKIMVFISISLFGFASISYAYFQDMALGVRPAGMGGAFVGLADDANAALYNPAGYGHIIIPQLTGMIANVNNLVPDSYQSQADRTGYNFIGLVVPGMPGIGGFGASWAQFRSEFYGEKIVTAGYGRSFNAAGQVSVGASLKLVQWIVTDQGWADQQGYNTTQKNGVTLDLGILSALSDQATIGVAFENIIAADMGPVNKVGLPMILRSGISYKIPFQKGTVNLIQPSIELSYRDEVLFFKAGAEVWLFDRQLAFRMGANRDEFNSGLSYCYKTSSALTLQVDYAFSLPYQAIDSLGGHRVGMTFGWDEQQHIYNKKQQIQKRNHDKKAAVPVIPALKTEPSTGPEPVVGQEVSIAEVEKERLAPIAFKLNKSDLSEAAHKTLKYLSGLLKNHQTWQAKVEGHACILGTKEYNQWLSEIRAGSVKKMLISKYGVNSMQIIPIGYGNKRPVASNETEEGRKKNRRVEIIIKDDKGDKIYP